jgi:hypothetical protein
MHRHKSSASTRLIPAERVIDNSSLQLLCIMHFFFTQAGMIPFLPYNIPFPVSQCKPAGIFLI